MQDSRSEGETRPGAGWNVPPEPERAIEGFNRQALGPDPHCGSLGEAGRGEGGW